MSPRRGWYVDRRDGFWPPSRFTSTAEVSDAMKKLRAAPAGSDKFHLAVIPLTSPVPGSAESRHPATLGSPPTRRVMHTIPPVADTIRRRKTFRTWQMPRPA
jgi:hypothetical protein